MTQVSEIVVVADEAHALKNASAQRTQRGRCWLVTGTPMENEDDEDGEEDDDDAGE